MSRQAPDQPRTRLDTAGFIERARAVHGDRFDYSASHFVAVNKKVTVICRVHGPFETSPYQHLRGAGCQKCSGKARKTTEEFIAEARAIHGEKYDYSRVVYINNSTKVEVICPEHGPFFPKPNNHLVNQTGCPACAGCRPTTLADFLARAQAAHGDRYDYSRTEYRNTNSKVTVLCREHGAFEQIASDHTSGHGCPACGAKQCIDVQRWSTDDFITRARAVHGDRYDYSQAVYVNAQTPIVILCPEHGPFEQVATYHLDGNGCQRCAHNARVDAAEFLRRATESHGDRYDYSRLQYRGTLKPAEIVCKDHGPFWQIPKFHMTGSGCPACATALTSSRGERDVADWIADLGVEVVRNDRQALGGFEIDIWIPEHRVGIEYNGAYWHNDRAMPHPRLHETKSQRAKILGVDLMTVWDFDWEKRRDIIQRMIRHRLGMADSTPIHARSCAVVQPSAILINAFYQDTHVQGGVASARHHYGLQVDGDLVAGMSFAQGASRRGKTGDGEWELLRYATRGLVRGGASRLFRAFIREQSPKRVWSYSDRQFFPGRLYPRLGFVEDGSVRADYRVFHQASRTLWHKSSWQRCHIQKRLIELGLGERYDPASDPRTEREMQELAGVMRIMDSGKIRWRWDRA